MHPNGKRLIVLLIALSSYTSSMAQLGGWTMFNCGKELYLTDLFFLNADTGWTVGYDAAGTYGLILTTEDGGESWRVQDSSSTIFWAIQFTDSENGWALGYQKSANQGALYQTGNGGDSWYLNRSFRYELNDLYFLNRDTGYVAGGGRGQTAVFRTTDAGENWDSLDAWGGHMHTVNFVNDTLGWVAGEQGAVSKTIDGGETWHTSYVDVGFFHILSLHAIDEDTAWMVGNDQIFKTQDGGEVWKAMADPTDAMHKSCFFTDSKTGWVSLGDFSESEIIHTSDGGESWQVQVSLPNVGNLSSLFFINETTGWCCGAQGTILKTSSAGIVSINDLESIPNGEADPLSLEQNYPNPFYTQTTISYRLLQEGPVKLVVYNIRGEEVRILVNGTQPAGKYSLSFDGAGLPSGVYYYKLIDRSNTSVKEMLLLTK